MAIPCVGAQTNHSRRVNLLRDLASASDEDVRERREGLERRVEAWQEKTKRTLDPLVTAAALAVKSTHTGRLPASFPFAANHVPWIERDDSAKPSHAPDGTQSGTSCGNSAEGQRIRALVIALPSLYALPVRKKACLLTAANIERRLREAQASTALDDLRAHLITKDSVKKTRSNVTGYTANTRARNAIRLRERAVQNAADAYRRAWRVLVSLGMSEDDTTFGRLRPEDVKTFTLTMEDQQLVDSKTLPSWIRGDFIFVTKVKKGAVLQRMTDGEFSAAAAVIDTDADHSAARALVPEERPVCAVARTGALIGGRNAAHDALFCALSGGIGTEGCDVRGVR